MFHILFAVVCCPPIVVVFLLVFSLVSFCTFLPQNTPFFSYVHAWPYEKDPAGFGRKSRRVEQRDSGRLSASPSARVCSICVYFPLPLPTTSLS